VRRRSPTGHPESSQAAMSYACGHRAAANPKCGALHITAKRDTYIFDKATHARIEGIQATHGQ